MILSTKKCLEILRRNNVPENIANHCLKVNEIAVYLGQKLQKAGEHVNLNLVNEASLLHDIDKHLTLTGKRHGEEAPLILEKEEMPHVISVVSKHHLHKILESGEKGLNTWEEKLVFYADKRVVHDKIVSLEERFAYLEKRYGQTNKDFQKLLEDCWPKVNALEKEIFSKAKTDVSLSKLKND